MTVVSLALTVNVPPIPTDPPAAPTQRPSRRPIGNASIATDARPVSRWRGDDAAALPVITQVAGGSAVCSCKRSLHSNSTREKSLIHAEYATKPQAWTQVTDLFCLNAHFIRPYNVVGLFAWLQS